MKRLIGGIEAGGSKFRCSVARDPQSLVADATIATGDPQTTLQAVLEFFRAYPMVEAVGIASFGPLDLRPDSLTYGWITGTPKLPWQNCDLLGAVTSGLGVTAGIETDVVAAAMAEQHFGFPDAATLVYLTVGTGVGAGYILEGCPPPARMHAEMGHMLIAQDVVADPFDGTCPFHGNCLEGLASATALRARWQQEPADLPDDHPGWTLQATYLAEFCVNVVRMLAPQRIVLGGGVMERAGLLDRVRVRYRELMAGYQDVDFAEIPNLLVSPRLAPDAGLVGALLLAERLQARG